MIEDDAPFEANGRNMAVLIGSVLVSSGIPETCATFGIHVHDGGCERHPTDRVKIVWKVLLVWSFLSDSLHPADLGSLWRSL